MRILVIGRTGQVATALSAVTTRANRDEILYLGRPEIDLEMPEGIADIIAGLRPEIVINAAAYTNVDGAEAEPERAQIVNATAAGQVARGAALADAVIIHVSTDYVFDGALDRAYLEGDPVMPLGVYGRSKFEGEKLVAAANPRHIIARSAWIYSPWGKNFLKTMLRLGAEHETLSVVDDQVGNPTSAVDLAEALLSIAGEVVGLAASDKRWGLYNVAGTGAASWHSFAREIFRLVAIRGQRVPRLIPVATADYRTPAPRPANSRLDCRRLRDQFAITLPDWRDALPMTMETLLDGR